MAAYSYKRARELIPQHLEDEYREKSGKGDDWYWDNQYDGDMFDALADYILELEIKLVRLGAMDSPNDLYYNQLKYEEMIKRLKKWKRKKIQRVQKAIGIIS